MAVPYTQLENQKDVKSSRGLWRKAFTGYAFILPALLLYLFFFIYPFVISFYYSLTDWNGAQPVKNFVGLANYQALFTDKLLGQALYHNVIWVLLGTVSPIAIGLLLGVLLWSGARGLLLFRTIYFLPFILSEVVIAIIWSWLYHPLWGPVNQLLKSIGLGSVARGWLGDPTWALPALIIAAIWSAFGFSFVVIMAGLQDVDKELVEAAMIDGADPWQRFRHVIIPQLRHVLTMLVALIMIGGFNVFGIVFVMTQGGPGTATQVIATYTYRKAFQQSDIGYGATLSVVMTVITLFVTYIFIRIRERTE